MGKRRLQMIAIAMAFVMAAGQSGAGFGSAIGSVTKVCAESEDTTEQEYITADGCYTYKILDAEKKTAALTKVDKTKLSVTEVDSQNVLTIPSKVDDEYTVTELGDNLFCMVYEVGPVDSQTEDADSNQTGETDSDQIDDTDGDQTEDKKNNHIEKVVIPDTVTRIGYQCFYNCMYAVDFDIPESVVDFGGNAFCYTLWMVVKQTERSDKLVIVNHVLLDGRACKGNVTVPEGVTKIADRAFNLGGNEAGSGSALVSITLPKSLRSIGDCAFLMNVSLENVVTAEGLTTVGVQAFAGCEKLETILMPSTLSSIAGGAFYKCSSLNTVNLAKTSMDTISVNCFSACPKLTNVDLPHNLSWISRLAFYGCTALSELKLPASVTTIGEKAFLEDPNLMITVPEELTDVSGWSNLMGKNVTFYIVAGGPVEAYMKENSFSYRIYGGTKQEPTTEPTTEPSTEPTTEPSTEPTTEPSTETKPETTKKPSAKSLIGKTVKKGKLQYKILSTTGVSVKKPVKKTYKEIIIPKTIKYYGRTYKVTKIENKAFQGCKSLKTVEIGNNVKKIGDSAFRDCTKLVNVMIGNNVTSIGKHTFRGCKKLKEIVITNYVKTIGDSAFQDCPALAYITIGARVETIGKNAFRNDKKIKEIEIKTKRLKKIGKKALQNTKKGKIIRVPSGKKKAYTKLIKAAK